MVKSELVDLPAKVLIDGDKAYRLDVGGDVPIWVPKSQCEVNDDGTVTMPRWLAKERGLI